MESVVLSRPCDISIRQVLHHRNPCRQPGRDTYGKTGLSGSHLLS
jgi:hypothetical protein